MRARVVAQLFYKWKWVWSSWKNLLAEHVFIWMVTHEDYYSFDTEVKDNSEMAYWKPL